MEVYVLNKEGHPLMPCKQARTTTLIERRKAHSSTGQATVVSCA